jgi:hypothetical protein
MSEEKPNFHVLLATPCYGGQMMRGYAQSCLNLQRLCDANGIKLDILTIGNESLITRARNFYVSLMLAKKEYTHLLFVDADISFNPINVLRMLTSGKDVVAGSYPKKGINWEKISTIARENVVETEFIAAASYDYAVNIITENTIFYFTEPGWLELCQAYGFKGRFEVIKQTWADQPYEICEGSSYPVVPYHLIWHLKAVK